MSGSDIFLEQFGIKVEDVLDALPLTIQPLTIFLSGSIIEGFGNAESDLDVFLIYDDEIPVQNADYTFETTSISFEYVSDLRLDIESWLEQDVLAVAQRLNHCAADDWNACATADIGDILFGHRIRIGIPIWQTDNFKQIQEAFDFKHLSHLIATRNLVAYTGIVEDAAGAIASEQHGTALLMSRQAVQLAIDFLLAVHGETNTKEKWRFFKLDKLGDSALVERYWELETPRIENKNDVFDYAKACLTFANQITLRAQKMLTSA